MASVLIHLHVGRDPSYSDPALDPEGRNGEPEGLEDPGRLRSRPGQGGVRAAPPGRGRCPAPGRKSLSVDDGTWPGRLDPWPGRLDRDQDRPGRLDRDLMELVDHGDQGERFQKVNFPMWRQPDPPP